MTRHLHLPAAALAALLLFAGIPGLANTASDETALRAIVQRLQDGWNAGDGAAFAAPFAPDADYVVVNGSRIKGREAIERGHTAIFTTIYKGSHNVATIESIRFLRPDVAVVHVGWSLEYRAGDQTVTRRAANSLVATREKGEWSIAAFHNTPVEARQR